MHDNQDYLMHDNQDYLMHDNQDYLMHDNQDYLMHDNQDYLSRGSQNSHVTVFGSIQLVFRKSGVLRTVNGAGSLMQNKLPTLDSRF
jgi:pyruvate/2-oxoacid:ferredoxin oxidoreductase beta subunit